MQRSSHRIERCIASSTRGPVVRLLTTSSSCIMMSAPMAFWTCARQGNTIRADDLHGLFGGEEHLATVVCAAEFHPLFGNLRQGKKGDHLKAPAVLVTLETYKKQDIKNTVRRDRFQPMKLCRPPLATRSSGPYHTMRPCVDCTVHNTACSVSSYIHSAGPEGDIPAAIQDGRCSRASAGSPGSPAGPQLRPSRCPGCPLA